ncbi:hypothetical protein ABK040_007808 [Willaertia magna]
MSSENNNFRLIDANEPPNISVLSDFYPHLKIHYCDIHPVKSWVLFADKRGSIYLFDYLQNDMLHSFSLNSMFESKREETNLYRTLDKNFKNVQLPYWYDEELFTKNEKIGDLKAVKFYDEHVEYWKKRQVNGFMMYEEKNDLNHTSSNTRNIHEELDDEGNTSRSMGTMNSLAKGMNMNRPPKCIVLQTDMRIIMMRYDEVSSLMFFFDEVKSSQLDNKNITCFDFLYKQPIIAIGCSDGSIRFWDYQQRKVINKIILNAHTKPITHMITIQRDDPLSKYPGLITTSTDGNLIGWNLDTDKADYIETKCQGNIVGLVIDPYSGFLITTGTDKTIAIRSSTTGKVINLVKMKGSMKSLCMVTSSNCIPSWLMMLENKKQKRILYRIPANINFDQEFLDKHCIAVENYSQIYGKDQKDPKFYCLVQHPLQPSLCFLCTSFGLMMVKMDHHRKPPVSSGYLRSLPTITTPNSTFNSPNMNTLSPSVENQQPQLIIDSNISEDKRRYVLYVREKNIYQRYVITNNDGKKEFSSEKSVYSLGRIANVKLGISYSGKYVSVFWENEKEYFIFDITKDWKNIASDRDVVNIVWSSSDDTFAVLKGNEFSRKILLKKIEHANLKLVVETVTTASTNIDDIFGGILLGVKYGSQHSDENGFQFFSWNSGRDAFGIAGTAYLPKPRFLEWDSLTGKCLMAYVDSYAIFSYKPVFKMECYVDERIESAFWWNATLFISTQLEIKAIFVSNEQLFSTVLASFDIALYSHISQKTPMDEQNSLDPVPLPRPKGILSFIDVVGDTLYVLDSYSQIHSINNISITPSIKFRMLVAAGLTKKAMQWIPFIAQEIHDYLSDFLCAFGYTKQACSIDSLSSFKRLQLCFEHEHVSYGWDALKYLDDHRIYYRSDNIYSSNKNEEDNLELSKLYVRLGSVGEKRLNKIERNQIDDVTLILTSPIDNNHLLINEEDENSLDKEVTERELLETIEQCYKRASELDPNTFSHLVIFYAKYNVDKLNELKLELYNRLKRFEERKDDVSINAYRKSLTICALVTKDSQLASELFKQQQNKLSVAATLDNSKIEDWTLYLNSKPYSLPVQIGQ